MTSAGGAAPRCTNTSAAAAAGHTLRRAWAGRAPSQQARAGRAPGRERGDGGRRLRAAHRRGLRGGAGQARLLCRRAAGRPAAGGRRALPPAAPPPAPAWRADLAANHVAEELFPSGTWARLTRRALSEAPEAMLRSAPHAGLYELREAIARLPARLQGPGRHGGARGG